ncbi:ABC transporter ATP-binding protein [Pseudonocardia endophytica]|uniref:Fatty acid ABC transporter ATP-binding/permease protein n=1 Tax=Pseudonocardia endophytica TaxID=401976 RepID=A0A4R1HST2_PSEEN|nr:ABC transporter ATP-binding protein [Pseudonocardia endophytica]TCK25714.1 ATP-binding cassette subfamily B protein [Pseudonocardia endophytica]
MATLVGFAAGARGPLIAAVLLAVGATVLELLPVYVVYRLVDDLVAGGGGASGYYVWAVVALVAIVLRFVLFGLSTAVSHRAAFRLLYDLRVAMARHLARLPLGFFSNRRSGEVKKVMVDDAERLEGFLAHGIPDIVSSVAVWIGVTIWLFVLDWRMALASIVVVPIAFACLSSAMRRVSGQMAEYQKADARMNGSVVEYVNGMPVVKVFDRTGESFTETREAVEDYARLETDYAKQFVPLGSAFYTVIVSSLAVIAPVGIWLQATGRIDLTTLLFFFLVGAAYGRPLMTLFNQASQFAQYTSGGALIGQILGAPELPDTGERVELDGYDVELRDVRFAYDGRDVLHGVSFTARTGQVTALVGPSGAGKTTIARLIPRFADVDDGAVLLGGVDVRAIGVDQLMETISFVFQDTFLFHDTIADNIRLGKPSATDADVEAAARAARVHDFVSALPDGYATTVGERGSTLSGGEKQRIAIARAILKDSPVVILDEATAFADPENESAIQEAVGELVRGKTLLVIAHRLSTVVHAERILVVDDGRVVESGRHDELVARGGAYARLWEDYDRAQSIVLHAGERSR